MTAEGGVGEAIGLTVPPSLLIRADEGDRVRRPASHHDPRRKVLLVILGALVLILPSTVRAQPKLYKVGVVSHIPLTPVESALVDVFRQELERLGYTDGQNLTLQSRFGADGIQELLRSNVDVLVAMWSPAALAAKRATASVPIVVVGPRDPVGQGLVQSLARPGGNVTGLSAGVGVEIAAKRVQILKELAPRLSRVAYLTNLGFPGTRPSLVTTERAAKTAGFIVQPFDVRSESDIDNAFARMVRDGFGGGIAAAELGWMRGRIIALAAKHRLPFVHSTRESVEDGGLASYRADRRDMFRRAAGFVDRILKGAKPAELPVEQPTVFELVLNLKTAKALGLIVPPSLLVSATEVIQ